MTTVQKKKNKAASGVVSDAKPATITVSREDLLSAIKAVMPAVPSKTTLPILSHVLMAAADGWLTLTATNLDIAITHRLRVSGDIQPICLPAKRLLDCLASIPKLSQVTIALGDNASVSVSAGPFTWGAFSATILVMNAGNFPGTPQSSGEVFTLPSAPLRRMIRQTMKAISKEESRFTLNAAKLTVSGGGMTMAATDGHRLHICDEPVSGNISGDIAAVIPGEALPVIAAIARTDVIFSADDSHLFFSSGDTSVVSRKASGNFPDTGRLFVKPYAHETVLPVADTLAAVKAVAIFADSRLRCLTCKIGGNRLLISAASLDNASAEASVGCDYDSDPVTFGLRADYVMDALREMVGPFALLKFTDHDKQFEFAEMSYRTVIMPMRVSQ